MNFSFFAEIFFPSVCLSCGARSEAASCCTSCRRRVSIARERFSEFHAATSYGDPVIKKLIHNLKFNFMKSAAEPLGDIIADYVAQCPELSFPRLNDAVIVPIPLSRKRERFRGFNQSELIARRLGSAIGLPVQADILARVRDTKPQSETTSAVERKRNLLGCFAVRRSSPPKIILIDDVVTTGSTFHEATRVLYAEGANTIIPIAVARS